MIQVALIWCSLAATGSQDTEKVRRFIEAIERDENEVRWRLFQELKTHPDTGVEVAAALADRTDVDAVVLWLARLLAQAPVPADESARSRIVTVLQKATPPESAARTDQAYKLLVCLEVRAKYGDQTAVSALGAILEDRQTAFSIRLGASEILAKGGDTSTVLLEFVGDEQVPFSDRITAAVALVQIGNGVAIEFLKAVLRGDRPDMPPLGEKESHELFEGLAVAATIDPEAWRMVLAEAIAGDPLLVRTILGTLERSSRSLAVEFARAYLRDEVEGPNADYDETALKAAIQLMAENDHELLEQLLAHVGEIDGLQSVRELIGNKFERHAPAVKHASDPREEPSRLSPGSEKNKSPSEKGEHPSADNSIGFGSRAAAIVAVLAMILLVLGMAWRRR